MRHLMFQFTRPRGARLGSRTANGYPVGGFNSRAREGRDENGTASPGGKEEFQFTRPRGARQYNDPDSWKHDDVSIHAPARGATPTRATTGSASCGFNSRAREGRDPHPGHSGLHMGCFNSRAREGRDGPRQSPPPGGRCFNSRAREGRDTAPRATNPSNTGFNSRAREGRDWLLRP